MSGEPSFQQIFPSISAAPAKNKASIREIFPEVLSASRATDIPAFHSGWLIERLRQGFCEWQNPFNLNQRQIVNFTNVKAIVFWSKNPAPLMPYLDEIADSGKKFYFQFTLNDYETEGLEPGLPNLETRIKIFTELAAKYTVIWRYDPIVFGGRLTIKNHLRKIQNLTQRLGAITPKLVFSFIDIYSRIRSSLGRFNPDYRTPYSEEMYEFCQKLQNLRDKFAPGLDLATCAEDELDRMQIGIQKNSCIDQGLINKLCGIPTSQPSLLDLTAKAGNKPFPKDKGQRPACGCAPSKDIGSYRSHPCKHGCRYCYAGHAKK